MASRFKLMFLTNRGKWQTVESGSKAEMETLLRKHASLFNDAPRYKIAIDRRMGA